MLTAGVPPPPPNGRKNVSTIWNRGSTPIPPQYQGLKKHFATNGREGVGVDPRFRRYLCCLLVSYIRAGPERPG
eukprot:6465842-Amphidinium_carterae.2